ncbi:hypothetical protein D3C80_1455530 [compost metagenome]
MLDAPGVGELPQEFFGKGHLARALHGLAVQRMGDAHLQVQRDAVDLDVVERLAQAG